MKRLFYCLTAMLALAACGDPLSGGGSGGNGGGNGGGNTPAPEITFGQGVDSAPQVVAAGGDVKVAFKATADWTAGVTETKALDWISVQPTSGKAGDAEVTITVKPNEGTEKRAAVVVFKSGEVQKTVTVSQGQGSWKDEEWFATYYWERTDLQKTGLRGPVESFHIETPQYSNDRYTTYYFDRQGHMVREEFKIAGDASYDTTTLYTYDDEGRLTRIERKSNLTETWTFEYGNGTRYVAVNGYNWISQFCQGTGGSVDFSPVEHTLRKGLSAMHYVAENELYADVRDYTYDFDASGNLAITGVCQRGEGRDRLIPQSNDDSWVQYAGGLPVSSSYYNSDYQAILPGVESCTYAENGMPLKAKMAGGNPVWTFVPNNQRVIPESVGNEWTFSYNKHRDLISDDRVFTAGPRHSEYKDYVYDSHGNWISRTEEIEPELYDGNPQSKIVRYVKRIILYYE